MSRIKRAFNFIGTEVINSLRDNLDNRLDEAEFEERVDCIRKAALALNEAGVDREEIIRLLQKYWDLRRSEAELFIGEE